MNADFPLQSWDFSLKPVRETRWLLRTQNLRKRIITFSPQPPSLRKSHFVTSSTQKCDTLLNAHLAYFIRDQKCTMVIFAFANSNVFDPHQRRNRTSAISMSWKMRSSVVEHSVCAREHKEQKDIECKFEFLISEDSKMLQQGILHSLNTAREKHKFWGNWIHLSLGDTLKKTGDLFGLKKFSHSRVPLITALWISTPLSPFKAFITKLRP